MDIKEFEKIIRQKESGLATAYPVLMRKVYTWMTFAMIITGICAYGVATSPVLMHAIFSNPLVFWGMLIAEFVLVIGLGGALRRLSLMTATLMFILYSVINGALLSSIFLVYAGDTIAQTFFITAATFGVMSAWGFFTRKDLSGMGSLLTMALIGIVLASLANVFLKISGLAMIINYVGVLVFVGLTAFDTQKIKNMLLQSDDASEEMQKIALLGALTLYLDFINMFLFLLRIFGGNRK